MSASNNLYPSKQQIIDKMESLSVSTFICTLEGWKRKHYTNQWKQKSTEEKMVCLEGLAYIIYYAQKNPSKLIPVYVKHTNRYAFHVKKRIILINDNQPSILSTLHEVGHAMYGVSETNACAFSVKLFAKVFPNEYKRLEWRGHMLKLPDNKK